MKYLWFLVFLACSNAPIQPGKPFLAGSGNDARLFITLDDGLASQDTAVKILDAHDFHGVFFVNPGWVDSTAHMGWDDLGALAQTGHEIGNHGYWHLNLSRLDSAERVAEITGGYEVLADSGFDVLAFTPPYGWTDEQCNGIAFENQLYVRTTEWVTVQDHFWMYSEVGCVEVKRQGGGTLAKPLELYDVPPDTIKSYIAQAYNQEKVLILCYHGFCWQDGCANGVKIHIDEFEEVIQYADSIGIVVCTFAEYAAQ